MTDQLRRKYSLVFLCLYWPTHFILTHIPLPGWTYKAGLSDKSLHFLAYFILVFLLWGAIKPYQRIQWRKATVWCILLFIVCYGALDEWLQYYVSGRTVDIHDLFANLAGSISSLILLTLLPFWTASLVVSGLCLYIATNCARINMTQFIPFAYPAFFLFGYMFFTLLWLFYLHKYSQIQGTRLNTTTIGSVRWFVLSLGGPLVLLVVSQLRAYTKGRTHPPRDILLPVIGILIVVTLTAMVSQYRQRHPAP